MDQAWFEMQEIRRRVLDKAVWVPLRAAGVIGRAGECGRAGYSAEHFAAVAIMVPVSNRPNVEQLGWRELGFPDSHCGDFREGEYVPSDIFSGYSEEIPGIHPVLVEPGNSEIGPEWHLHQDFVVTLRLRREGDVWFRPGEGYLEIARLKRDDDRRPQLLEVRASHFRDYLCARTMGLYVTSCRSRDEVVEDASRLTWESSPIREESDGSRWEGCIREIHEGGQPFGQETVVLEITRTDVDSGEDVPVMAFPPPDEHVRLRKGVVKYEGRKLFHVSGQLWRNEWLAPATASPLVRGDDTPATIFFITDAADKRETKETLIGGRRWLWFQPEVIMNLADRRGGSLGWHTRDTGTVGCVVDYGVHFGVNERGLINVYAKDIGSLPDWQQQVWSGFNVGPDGGVCAELSASQARGEPADTQAPEFFLPLGLATLNEKSTEKLGLAIIKFTDHTRDIISRCHRFRAVERGGVFSLAKDLARLTADSFDVAAIQRLARPPDGGRLGSLKSLEGLLATNVGREAARSALSPLHWIYDLRNADAHLASKDVGESLKSLGVDATAPHVIQGRQLISACVSGICAIIRILHRWDESSTPT